MSPVHVGLLALIATGLGLANLHSVATDAEGLTAPLFRAQVAHAALGLVAFLLVRPIPPGRLRELARPAWLCVVALMVAALVGGHVAGGARSWLDLGPIRLQPVELMKLALPLAVAAEACRPAALRRWLDWARLGVLVVVPLGLAAAQPDLGGAGLLALGALSLVWVAGLPRYAALAASTLGLLAAPLGWLALAPYQQSRVLTFLDPTRDPSGAGYQSLQSLYAFAAGGLRGVGYGAGTQGRLGYLPEHQTDFVLAVLVEEWGLLGGLLALAVLFALVAGGLSIAGRARDRFSALLATGLSVQLLWQVVVNAGGVLGLLPLTGVTLPFFSYGGSSMVGVWMAVGLLASLARRPVKGLAPGQVRFGPNEVVPDFEAVMGK